MDRIPESIQKAVKDYILKLSRDIPVKKVILFGSYARGTSNEHSDIDLAVFSDYFKNMNRVDGIHLLLLKTMDCDLDIDIEPQPFTMEEYNDPHGFVEEILKTGIEINIH